MIQMMYGLFDCNVCDAHLCRFVGGVVIVGEPGLGI